MEERIPEKGTCCFCGGEYIHWGNNPEPIGHWPERCCDPCNLERVIPARLKRPRR